MKLTANLFAGLLVLLAAQTVSAQSSYPNRPVKILVGSYYAITVTVHLILR